MSSVYRGLILFYCFINISENYGQINLDKKSTFLISLDLRPLGSRHFLRSEFLSQEHLLQKPSLNLRAKYNFKLLPKLSVSLLGQYGSFKPPVKDLGQTRVNRFEYGLGFNYFLNNQYAPIGSSIGVFIQKSSFHQEVYKKSSSQTQNIETGSYTDDGIVIGLSLSNMYFLSDKLPIYLEYSITAGYRHQTKELIEIDSEEIDSRIDKEDFTLFSYIKNLRKFGIEQELFKINLGIGYWF